jgi:hypothetical protein
VIIMMADALLQVIREGPKQYQTIQHNGLHILLSKYFSLSNHWVSCRRKGFYERF